MCAGEAIPCYGVPEIGRLHSMGTRLRRVSRLEDSAVELCV